MLALRKGNGAGDRVGKGSQEREKIETEGWATQSYVISWWSIW